MGNKKKVKKPYIPKNKAIRFALTLAEGENHPRFVLQPVDSIDESLSSSSLPYPSPLTFHNETQIIYDKNGLPTDYDYEQHLAPISDHFYYPARQHTITDDIRQKEPTDQKQFDILCSKMNDNELFLGLENTHEYDKEDIDFLSKFCSNDDLTNKEDISDDFIQILMGNIPQIPNDNDVEFNDFDDFGSCSEEEDEEEEDEDSFFNQQFKTTLLQYDDDCIGDLSNRLDECHIGVSSSEYKDLLNEELKTLRIKSTRLLDHDPDTHFLHPDIESIYSNDDEKDLEIDNHFNGKSAEEWDVETIISTYSNIENHPIVIPPPQRKTKATHLQNYLSQPFHPSTQHHLQSSDLANFPIEIHQNSTRTKNETIENKKYRKKIIKLQKKQTRQRKKLLKQVYSQEKHIQQKEKVKQQSAQPSTTIHL